MNRLWIPFLALAASLGFEGTCFAQVSHGSDEGGAAPHISQGIALARLGQTGKALEEFKAATRLDPNSSQALLWLGITYNQLGRFQESIAPFSRAVQLDSKLESAHYNLALSFARLGRRQDAIREFKEVVTSSPSMADAQYNLAVLLEQEGNAAEAVAHLEAARRDHPNDVEIRLHLARDLFLTHRGGEAVGVAQKLFQQRGDQKIAQKLGELLIENGCFADAVPMLEKAQTASPASLELRGLLAHAYIGSNSPAKAVKLLDPHKDSDNSGATAYLLGLAYLSNSQPVPALQSFRIAAELRPSDPMVHFHLGVLLLKSSDGGDQGSGVSELQKAIELAPRESANYTVLGRWLIEHDHLREGISVLQDGEEHGQPSAELYTLLSVAEALGQSPQAQVTAQKAIALDPKIALAHDVLGFFYFRSGDYLRAAGSYRTASDLSPQTGRFAYDTALALERANKPDEALSYAQRAASADPDVAINHYLLGKLYSKLERKPESIRELETTVRLDPSLDYPYYLLARMYMRTGEMAKAQELNLRLQELKKQQMRLHGMGTMISEPEAAPSLLLEKGRLDSGATQH